MYSLFIVFSASYQNSAKLLQTRDYDGLHENNKLVESIKFMTCIKQVFFFSKLN